MKPSETSRTSCLWPARSTLRTRRATCTRQYRAFSVLATQPRALGSISELGHSRWIQVAGSVTKAKHVVQSQTETDIVLQLLKQYWCRESHGDHLQPAPLYVITPFRDIMLSSTSRADKSVERADQ
jgi:hypothetical protein